MWRHLSRSSQERLQVKVEEADRARRKPPMPEKRSAKVDVCTVGGVEGISVIKVMDGGIREGLFW